MITKRRIENEHQEKKDVPPQVREAEEKTPEPDHGIFGGFGQSVQKPAPERRRLGVSAILLLPLAEFVREILNRAQWFPDSENWRSPLFDFARWMKARPELPTDGLSAAVAVEQALAELAPDDCDDPWDYHFGGLPTDDPRAEFIATWGRIRTPANMDALQVAAREAERLPLKLLRFYSTKHSKLISLAGHLQKPRLGQSIALPVERIAEVLNCNRKYVGEYLKFAMQEQLLSKVTECVPHHRAAEFIFAVERFDWKTGSQIK